VTRTRHILATVASVTVALSPIGAIAIASHAACDVEDQLNCVWIAPIMGNGEGDTFATVKIGPLMVEWRSS
jgi:hypothetical protein